MDNSNYNGPSFQLSKCKVTWLSLWSSWDQILLSYDNHTSFTELAEHCLSKEKLVSRNGIVYQARPSVALSPLIQWNYTYFCSGWALSPLKLVQCLWTRAGITAIRLVLQPDLMLTQPSSGKPPLTSVITWSYGHEEALAHWQEAFTHEFINELSSG